MKKTASESKGRVFGKNVVITAAAFVLALLLFVPSVYSADNFAVKSAGGATLFTVTDTGFVGAGIDVPLYAVDVSSTGQSKSSLHFSLSGTDTGGWITSVGDNNFFLSSGAVYDLAAGGWIQKSSDGNAVVAGSGGAGYRLFTGTGTAVGGAVPLSLRLQINYAGNVGINTAAVAGVAISTSTGASLSAGGVWTNASSREYKENIKELSSTNAMETLKDLKPVTFEYKTAEGEQHVGFIAEDVPDLVATKDRKGLSPMDIVAVLTKVVQEKSATIDILVEKLNKLEAEVNRLKSKDLTASIVVQ